MVKVFIIKFVHMGNFYVYLYLNPLKRGNYIFGKLLFEYEPFYVGKGKNSRYMVHNYNSVIDERNKLKQNTINKIRRHGLKPIIVKQYVNLTEFSAFRLEKQLIKLIGRRDLKTGSLCNLTDGGEGAAGAIYDYEKRCNMISNKEKIVKYDLNGVVVEIFKNIIDVSIKYPNLRTNHIHRACKSQSRILDNYYWKYHGNENVGDIIDIPDNKKKILQYGLDGKFIQIHNSSNDIRKLGYPSGAILKCCRNNQKCDKLFMFKNFMWVFYNQNNKIESHISPYYTNNATGSNKLMKDNIQMISLNGEILGEYSPKELKNMGFLTKTIYRCCNGELKKSQGYVWKWVTKF